MRKAVQIFLLISFFVTTLSVSTPAVWVGSSDYQSGTISTVSSTGRLTFNYQSAFSDLPKKMLIGYTSIKSSNYGTTFRIDITVVDTGTTTGLVDYKFYAGGVTITAMQLRYMVVSSDIPWLSCNHNLPFDYFMTVLNPGCPALFTGYGQRSCYLTGNFFTGTGTKLDLSHKNVMLIWPQVLKMNTVAGKEFSFDWTSIWVNDENYQIKLTLYGNTTITNLTYNRLIYDQTSIEANQTIYLDGDVLNGTGSDFSQLSLNLLFTSSNSFMIGLSYWSIPQTTKFDYNFKVSDFTTDGAMSFNKISLGYWNYRFRTCPSGYPFFIESENRCYDECDPYFYPKTLTVKTCLPCHFSCLNCTSNLINACTKCSADDKRTLSSQRCVCSPGFYQQNVQKCGTCHFSCSTCSGGTNTNCLTCPSTRSLSGGRCNCNSPLIDTGEATCTNCTTEMLGCLTCTSKTVCTSCDASKDFVLQSGKCSCKVGTYLNGAVCSSCTGAIVGCGECSSSSTCVKCKAGQFFELSGSKCVCMSEYYNNSNTCSLCSAAIAGCDACTSPSSCTSCNSSGFFQLVGTSCQCKQGYYNLSNVCQLCSDDIIGCTQCTSGTICTACDTPNSFILNSSTCTCSSGKYLNITTRGCEVCTVNPNCSKCLNGTFCTECDTLMMIPDHGVCTQCSALVVGCKECSSVSDCDVCDSGAFFEEDNADGCICIEGRFLTTIASSDICKLCSEEMIGCTKCSSSNLCQTCNSTLNFQLISGECACIDKHFLVDDECLNCSTSCLCVGYYGTRGSCETVCGDGIFVEEFEECDDGNVDGRDGCSSECKIENGFECSTSSGQTVSHCSYTLPLEIGFVEIAKGDGCNCISLVIEIGPQEINFSNLNFSQLIIPNLNGLTPTNFTYTDGKVHLNYQYHTSIQGQNATFTLTPSKDGSFNLTPNSSIDIFLHTKDNDLLILYDEEVYRNDSTFNYIYYSSMVSSYLIFIMSMFTNKIVGIEMMGVIQIAFFALANLDFLTPYMKPMGKLKMVNGFNYQYRDIIESTRDTPDSVFGLKYISNISNNLNVMLLFPVLCITVGAGLYLIGKWRLVRPKRSLDLIRWSKRLFKQYFLTAAMFNLYNTSFSTAIYLKYNLDKTYSLLDYPILIISNSSVLILLCTLTFTLPSQFGEYKHKLNPDFMSRHYFIISVCYRYLLGFLIGYYNSSANITVIQFFLSSTFIMYLLSNRPFVEGYHNYRGVVCEATTLVILGVSMFYRSMKQNTSLELKSRILSPSYLHISAIIFCLSISLGVLIYQSILSIRALIRQKNNPTRTPNPNLNLTEQPLQIPMQESEAGVKSVSENTLRGDTHHISILYI